MKSFARPRGMEPSERTVASRLFPFARNFFFFFYGFCSPISPLNFYVYSRIVHFVQVSLLREELGSMRIFSIDDFFHPLWRKFVTFFIFTYYRMIVAFERIQFVPIFEKSTNGRGSLESLELACRKSESRDLEFMNEKAYATARTSSWHASPPLKVNPVGVVIVGTRGINVTNSGTVVT